MTKKHLELKIVFDTNVIYTGSSSELLRNEISELLLKYEKTADITLCWCLPSIVVNERRFQMKKKGFELIPHITKLEKLLGHNLAITEEIIIGRINDTINKQIEAHNLKVIELNETDVNWKTIVHNSTHRIPPFEDGDKEKGFRDSIIIETVRQLIANSPTSKSVCRIVFVTSDKLLGTAFRDCTKESNNVLHLETIDELQGLINVLGSEIQEEQINSIQESAGQLFFSQGNQESFYLKEGIGKTIRTNFAAELKLLPKEGSRRETTTWWIGKPSFHKKIKQRIYWKTIITDDFKTFKQKNNPYSVIDKILSQSQPNIIPSISTPQEEPLSTGKSKFEIIWSVTLTTAKSLKSPKVESITHIETVFE